MSVSNIVLEHVAGSDIIWRNFAGNETKYNNEGNRNFVLKLAQDIGQELSDIGWNVAFRANKNDPDDTIPTLKVKVRYGHYRPRIYLVKPDMTAKTLLTEDDISMLDSASIEYADFVITPYAWENNGKSGIAAYLKSMYIILEQDELSDKYGD